MKKISKEKRNQLILVCMVIGAIIAGLWFGLINFQQGHLARLQQRRDEASAKLTKVDLSIKNADLIESELGVAGKKLAAFEEDMASGDIYLWLVNNIRQFKLSYKGIDIPQISQPDVKDMNLLPKFPYKQVSLTIGGTAYFHDFGKFTADFENQFPHFRVMNLDLEPTPTVMGGDREKLTFKMEIVALIKPGAS
jgi:hypothetical protein